MKKFTNAELYAIKLYGQVITTSIISEVNSNNSNIPTTSNDNESSWKNNGIG